MKLFGGLADSAEPLDDLNVIAAYSGGSFRAAVALVIVHRVMRKISGRFQLGCLALNLAGL